MLKEILREINNMRVYSPALIAKNLNIDEELVKEAIFQLIRMRYISETEIKPNCDVKCGGCAHCSYCNIKGIKTFNITEKGRLLLDNM